MQQRLVVLGRSEGDGGPTAAAASAHRVRAGVVSVPLAVAECVAFVREFYLGPVQRFDYSRKAFNLQ